VENYIALRVRLKIYVLDTKYEKALVSDITLRVLEAFEAEGIQPPAILHRNVDERAGAGGPRALRLSGQSG
jgi:hypothetical protein